MMTTRNKKLKTKQEVSEAVVVVQQAKCRTRRIHALFRRSKLQDALAALKITSGGAKMAKAGTTLRIMTGTFGIVIVIAPLVLPVEIFL